MQEVTASEIFVPDPRWSWYGTPLWEVVAWRLYIRELDMGRTISNSAGGAMTADWNVKIQDHWLYFTHEEYVMWKLEDVIVNGIYDIRLLRRGIVYS